MGFYLNRTSEMVIVVLGILGAVAATQYVNLQGDATIANENGVSGAVRAGIKTFPATLNSTAEGVCSVTNVCFSTVLPGGVRDRWTRLSASAYRSPRNTSNVWTYSSTNGSVSKTTA